MDNESVKLVKESVNEIILNNMLNGCMQSSDVKNAIVEAFITGVRLGGMNSAVYHNFQKLNPKQVAKRILFNG